MGKPTVTRIMIAKKTGIAPSTITEIFKGTYPPGKKTAQKLSAITSRPWHEYLVMAPAEIEDEIKAALAGSDHPGQAGAA